MNRIWHNTFHWVIYIKTAKLKRYLYIVLGSFTLVIGTIGIFLPILPTTPLLLLTAYFYLRSSVKLYQWLMHHPIFGAYIYSYLKYKAIPLKTKVSAIIVLWFSISFSMYLVGFFWLRVMLAIIASIVTFYIGSLDTLSKDKISEIKQLQTSFHN